MKPQYISAAFSDAVTQRELENREVAYRAALEGIVLLKNSGGALPINGKKLALYGAGASRTVKGGTGSGEVNERHAISILEGLEQAGFEITTRRWIDDFEAECRRRAEGQKADLSGLDPINYMASSQLDPVGRVIDDKDIEASNCDTAIYVVSRQAGEGADKRLEKGEFALMSAETASIEKMAKSYKHSILVINSGSYMDIGTLDERLSAVIFFCQQGMEGGRAFADIVSGREFPSAKLTDSWARSYSDVPFGMEYSYLGGNARRQVYREGIYVGYRYYDSFGIKPRFHFGFGLSYTDFAISAERVELSGGVKLDVRVKNVGAHRGKETVQVYVSPPQGELKKEYQRLAGFAKTSALEPEAEETVTVEFPLSGMASFSEKDCAYILEKGDYILRVGSSSENPEPVAVISLDESVTLSKLTHVCPVKEYIEELTPTRHVAADTSALMRLSLKAADIKCETASYETPQRPHSGELDKVMGKLSTKDKIELCVGTGFRGMFATSYNYAPGTVGRTTDKLIKKGLINVNLADGPAGLRLLKVSALTKRNKLRFKDGKYMIGALENLPQFVQKLVAAGDEDKLLYQFTSSFPVGTALAQSWNTELCSEVGKAISREMREYSVTYWLAPAMNIHRNPLCGRNFEYMSEDPLLTGKIAAALTRGVQSAQGCYATIKHFACNNSEDQRTRSDSIVSERALREIYLKGFEICVKDAAPKSLMTSYNMLNGVYTPNSYDLCTKLLRNEWGFEGVVMTDWLSTLPGQGSAGKAIGAGNDLIMPGLPNDKLSIWAALKKGSLSPEALDTACANIANSILRSGVSVRR